jgi:hypothetical protein
MAKVIFGKPFVGSSSAARSRQHSQIFIVLFLGGKVTKADPERDFIRLGETSISGFSMGMRLLRANL